ncbi:VWA domain-containing protein [Rhodobacteraceae bacterium B1Z28]|uniref:VWA domain-containing protein n=1 Tax=Ruegeria haliotis TaxID=2747601 RepID=A0ABX2PU71_9RHOB|nr:vWA domain-containing protein [Ruegeria haliotis]NVO56687.1 VWA domain-containing protein [Ruegeria haliotis]
MSELDFTLLRPGWLILLPGLALAGWWVLSRAGGFGDWDRVADPQLMRAMAVISRIEAAATPLPLIALLSVVGICVIALSGPAVERRDAQTYRNLDGVFFVVDVSASVTEDARWPQMLTMGRFGVGALGSRPGGIIVYAGDAYVATDMTTDHRQLGQTFSLIDADTVPDKGSRPERALALAGQRIQDAGVLAGDIVLFSDGAGLGPASLQQIAALVDHGVRVSLVVSDETSAQAQTHASVGGGTIFTLDQTDDLGRWLSDDVSTRLEKAEYSVLFWHDLGRYVLVLSLFPLLFLFWRGQA